MFYVFDNHEGYVCFGCYTKKGCIKSMKQYGLFNNPRYIIMSEQYYWAEFALPFDAISL